MSLGQLWTSFIYLNDGEHASSGPLFTSSLGTEYVDDAIE